MLVYIEGEPDEIDLLSAEAEELFVRHTRLREEIQRADALFARDHRMAQYMARCRRDQALIMWRIDQIIARLDEIAHEPVQLSYW